MVNSPLLVISFIVVEQNLKQITKLCNKYLLNKVIYHLRRKFKRDKKNRKIQEKEFRCKAEG